MQIIIGARRPPHWRRNLALQKDEKFQQLLREKKFEEALKRVVELGWEMDEDPPRMEPRPPRKAAGK
ncbi:MAG: hypothetical protein MR009_08285 [Sutterellaceae bacterium]|nr:hypothetical protein [Sutterellaceae bacterium]MDY2868436.1 hypothetical protein [Mesosutterella sp.]